MDGYYIMAFLGFVVCCCGHAAYNSVFHRQVYVRCYFSGLIVALSVVVLVVFLMLIVPFQILLMYVVLLHL